MALTENLHGVSSVVRLLISPDGGFSATCLVWPLFLVCYYFSTFPLKILRKGGTPLMIWKKESLFLILSFQYSKEYFWQTLWQIVNQSVHFFPNVVCMNCVLQLHMKLVY